MANQDIIIVGSGNAALCAGIAAIEAGAKARIIEKAPPDMAGGNTKYTAGAFRFAYSSGGELKPLLNDPDDKRLQQTDFGSYPQEKFAQDLLGFNDGRPLSIEQKTLITESNGTMQWLAGHGIRFEPIYGRQSFEKNGKYVFWGGLTLAAKNEGVGLFEAQRQRFLELGGVIDYQCAMTNLITHGGSVTGVEATNADGEKYTMNAKAVILGCGGFEANAELRQQWMGEVWRHALVRGTPHNTGDGLLLALALGAVAHGFYQGAHATPMDYYMKEYGNLNIPHIERKNYRKICYFLGIMVNARGLRFVDEGKDFRNYTYAQFGRAVLDQPDHRGWQIFDKKVDHLLYEEYRFHDAHFTAADTIDELTAAIMDDADDRAALRQTIENYNKAVDDETNFDPAHKDGKAALGLEMPKSNWAQKIDTPPFKAYPVTGGITFTYGGLKVDGDGAVMHAEGRKINGLFACGEMVGGVFFNGYPGGSGLMSGAVFGRRAGFGAAK